MPECPHGFEIGVFRGPDAVMAAPFSFCECCKTNFYYIDSGSMSVGKDGSTRYEISSQDKKLCPECGGKVAHRVVEDGVTVLSEGL